MFHVMLILLPMVLLVIIGSMLLFGVTSIIASMIGGASVALLIKNKTIKQLLLIAFSILLLVGSLCILPFVSIFASALINIGPILSVIILAIILLLALAGIKISSTIQNKIAKRILIGLFCLIGVADVAVLCILSTFMPG